MIIIKPQKEQEIEILSAVPASDMQDYPKAVHYMYKGRRYMTFTDDEDYITAAKKALTEHHIRFEDLYDVTQCVMCIIMESNMDFYGREPYRKAFEDEAHLTWPVTVCNLLHDIVRYRLHKFFYYGDGYDNLCVYLDILTKISFPCKDRLCFR